MKKRTISLFVIIFFTVFFYGVYVGLYEVFPYQFLNSAKEVIFADNLHSQEDISDKIVISSIIDNKLLKHTVVKGRVQECHGGSCGIRKGITTIIGHRVCKETKG